MSARILCVHNALDIKLKKCLVLGRSHPTRDLVVPNPGLLDSIVNKMCATHHEELVISVLRRERVQSVTTVTLQVAALRRRGEDQSVKAPVHNGGTNRMQPRCAIPAHGCEEGESGPELV
jgi:hypothetical protein